MKVYIPCSDNLYRFPMVSVMVNTIWKSKVRGLTNLIFKMCRTVVILSFSLHYQHIRLLYVQ